MVDWSYTIQRFGFTSISTYHINIEISINTFTSIWKFFWCTINSNWQYSLGTFSITLYIISWFTFNTFSSVWCLGIIKTLIHCKYRSTFINWGFIETMFAFWTCVLIIDVNLTLINYIQNNSRISMRTLCTTNSKS